MEPTVYSKYIKRILDVICSLAAIIVFSWLYLILIILGTVFMRGNPFFVQERPGKDERIFKMIKFRTMDNRRDREGKLLPDKERVNKYGHFLRATSLDELPEAFNILVGDMSVVGPRPQLVRDMVFMTDEQRKRHTVRPGLSGLAQVNGRNDIDWEEKFDWDLVYLKRITFWGDFKIVVKTVKQAFFKREGAVVGNLSTAEDFGDYLLSRGKVDKLTYDQKQESAKELLETRG